MSLLVEPNLVTTIIPVFNRPDLVVDAVNSVLAQTHRPIEILIIDDGSTDTTPNVLNELASRYPEIKVFTQKNSGPGVARELGRINARGEYIQYLDSDDVLCATKFSSQVEALVNDSEAQVCYGKTEVLEVGADPSGKAFRLTGKKIDTMFPLFLRERWWFTSTPLYRREATEKIGPWSSECNEEDWEYDCRIAAEGGRLAYVDEFVSFHRRHQNHLSEDGTKDLRKLKARAVSRAKIFQHANRYLENPSRTSHIDTQDWKFFSGYAFLLARQCAAVGLTTEARAMLSISIDSLSEKTWQQRLFIKLVKIFGWKKAAALVSKVRG